MLTSGNVTLVVEAFIYIQIDLCVVGLHVFTHELLQVLVIMNPVRINLDL